MALAPRSTVVGVFEDRSHADRAVDQFLKAGFRPDQIGVAMKHTEDASFWSAAPNADDAPIPDDAPTPTESGAIAGALTGLGLGTLAGLGVVAGVVPVVGPAIAAGTLAVIISNAVAGARRCRGSRSSDRSGNTRR